MTSPFILERAKVLHKADSTSAWASWDALIPYKRELYIAMAQALTDHDTKAGRKVTARPKAWLVEDDWTIASYVDDSAQRWFDAAPAYPGGEK